MATIRRKVLILAASSARTISIGWLGFLTVERFSTVVSVIGTIVSFQPAMDEWKGRHFQTGSIVLSASVLSLFVSAGMTPAAAPTAKQQQ